MNGSLIVIDGPDGAGKKTQQDLLIARLEAEGIDYEPFDFPQYGNPSAWYVERYLNGDFGTLDEIGPKQASMFYAMDRFAAKSAMLSALAAGKLLVMNRYVLSNMAHQGGKIANPMERREFFIWLDELEYGIFGIPRPTLNIILAIDVDALQARIDTKEDRNYLEGKRRDIHEDDIEHLRAASRIYTDILSEANLEAETLFVSPLYAVVPAAGTPGEVHERVWAVVQTLTSAQQPNIQ